MVGSGPTGCGLWLAIHEQYTQGKFTNDQPAPLDQLKPIFAIVRQTITLSAATTKGIICYVLIYAPYTMN